MTRYATYLYILNEKNAQRGKLTNTAIKHSDAAAVRASHIGYKAQGPRTTICPHTFPAFVAVERTSLDTPSGSRGAKNVATKKITRVL